MVDGPKGGIEAAGSVAALVAFGNSFYGIASCLRIANVGEALVGPNLTRDCAIGR